MPVGYYPYPRTAVAYVLAQIPGREGDAAPEETLHEWSICIDKDGTQGDWVCEVFASFGCVPVQ
jgi:hypothetical protein